MRRLLNFIVIMMTVLSLSNYKKNNNDVVNVTNKRQLFFDTTLINEEQTTATLGLNKPVREGVVATFDDYWQGNCCDYFNVFEDVDDNGVKFYRMYYIGRWIYSDVYEDVLRVCYAYSYDAINWIFPELHLRTVNGNDNNNVILSEEDQAFDNFFVFKDSNPNCNPNERYKALAEFFVLGQYTELRSWVSKDGINWSLKGTVLNATQGTFDSLNTCYYDFELQKYVMYSRNMIDGYRSIQYATSDDFTNWTNPIPLVYADGKMMHMYTNNISKYYRANDYYIGLPTRYHSPTEDNSQNRVTDNMLMYSRDGLTFNRYDETYILNRPQDDLNWTYGDSYFASGMLETIDENGNKVLNFYTPENRFSTFGSNLSRYSLRADGFISYEANHRLAKVVTKPIKFDKTNFYLNYLTNVGGFINVKFLNSQGEKLLDKTISGNSTDELIFDEQEIELIANKEIVIEFELYDAKLFSYYFG